MAWKLRWIEWILGFILLVIWIIFGSNKGGFFVDEYFSFTNANTSPAEMEKIRESGVNIYSGQELINMCLISDKDERFDYQEVWQNQVVDTHPPLYYAIVHTVCSITMTRFGMIEIGLSINIIIAFLSYLVILKLVQLFIKNRTIAAIYAFLCCASFSFVNCFLFVRMYLLLTFFSLLLLYILCKYIVQETYPKKIYVQLFAVICAGILTHYYFLIYLAFSCFVVMVYLVYCKRFKNLIMGILTVCGAMACAYLIFPQSVHHILGGDRGSQAIENMMSSEFISRVEQMFRIVNTQVFGGCVRIVELIILVFFLMSVYIYIKKRSKTSEQNITYVLILIPAMLSFLLISKVAAYLTDRYIMALMPQMFLGSFLLMRRLLKYIWENKMSESPILVVMAVCVLIAYRAPLPFSIDGDKEYQSRIQEYGSDAKCIFLYDEGREWVAQCNLFQLENLNEITFLPHTDFLYYCTDFSQYDILILYNAMNLSGDEMQTIAETAAEKGQYTKCEYLFSAGYSVTYVLKR